MSRRRLAGGQKLEVLVVELQDRGDDAEEKFP
jgi:hypothetical protein